MPWKPYQTIRPLFSWLLCASTMGAVLSTYAGSKDIASLASAEADKPTEYDYVICGGGTAGCVLASRLTENPEVRVLAIEAGESDARQLYSRIPAGWPKLYKSNADWNFETTPQPQMAGRKMYLPRGKMLGGCSAINAQIYQHCAPSDYDYWESLGAEGWGWSSLKPYFRKAENFTPNPDYTIDLDERGKGGLWNTSYPPTHDFSKALIKAGIDIGIPENFDHNVERNKAGISRFQATVDSGGTRSSTSAAYLPALVHNRPNLKILTSTTVTRLVLDGDKVASVEVAQNKDAKRYYAKATKEVLVCLGAYGTPQLLQLSGIGDPTDLQKIGVDTNIDLPGVGKNLLDHLSVAQFFHGKPGTSCQYLSSSDVKSIPALAQWLVSGTGPLASNGCEVGAFLRSDNVPGAKSSVAPQEVNASGPDAPDLEILNSPLLYLNHSLTQPPNLNGDYFTIGAVGLRPKSAGTVTCATADAFDPPLIDHKYLTDKDGYDKRVLLEGLKLCRRLGEMSPVTDFCTSPFMPEGNSDEELMQHIEKHSETLYHPMCTCKIAPKEKDGVVDTKLRLYGVSNVRVCDASVFPEAVSGHPQAAVVAIAEKLSDILKG